ncbi:hypothetical protein [Psychrobacillus sp. NPDC096389]|uniref:hypothetical protein n=1 Tax=Psychrobacillus sp. NPDC096389 TaxID=3364490 RepID=UPI00381F7A8D
MDMNEQNNQPYADQLSAQERLQTAAIAMESNKQLHATDMNGKRGTDTTVDLEVVEQLIEDWPTLSKKVTKKMMEFYGPPNDTTYSTVIWYYNGPWKKTIVYKEGVPHDFPEPHVDMLEQSIDYHVPANKAGEIAKLEGSLVIDRTRGEVSVHCDNEGANTLSMNMMHEIVTGKRTAEEAREKIAEQITEFLMNRPAPYAEKFQFELPQKEQVDPDVTIVKDEELMQAVESTKKELNL